jgi:hypothetical protein
MLSCKSKSWIRNPSACFPLGEENQGCIDHQSSPSPLARMVSGIVALFGVTVFYFSLSSCRGA